MSLAGKTLFITGASRGIGAAMARGLARPGTRLITLARREDPELAAYARSQGAQLEQLSVDLSDLAAAEAAARRICGSTTNGPREARCSIAWADTLRWFVLVDRTPLRSKPPRGAQACR